MLETGEHPPAKTLVPLALDAHVHLRLAGGAGYGDPLSRPPEAVLRDVVLGFVTIEAAERDYGVVIRYTGGAGPPRAAAGALRDRRRRDRPAARYSERPRRRPGPPT